LQTGIEVGREVAFLVFFGILVADDTVLSAPGGGKTHPGAGDTSVQYQIRKGSTIKGTASFSCSHRQGDGSVTQARFTLHATSLFEANSFFSSSSSDADGVLVATIRRKKGDKDLDYILERKPHHYRLSIERDREKSVRFITRPPFVHDLGSLIASLGEQNRRRELSLIDDTAVTVFVGKCVAAIDMSVTRVPPDRFRVVGELRDGLCVEGFATRPPPPDDVGDVRLKTRVFKIPTISTIRLMTQFSIVYENRRSSPVTIELGSGERTIRLETSERRCR